MTLATTMIQAARSRISREPVHFCPIPNHGQMSLKPGTRIYECLFAFETDKPCRWRWKAGKGYHRRCGCDGRPRNLTF